MKLTSLFSWRQMARQIHCVVEKAQDLDYLPVLVATNSKHYEMTAFTTMARDMQRE